MYFVSDRPLIVAVDGPAAAGKGTLARRLAKELGLPYLDTGLLYRAVARKMVLAGRDPARDNGVAEARTLVAEDIARSDLRVPEIDRGASAVAKQGDVRAALLERQRQFGRETGAVLDGRDIGTIVFPDATVKLFVTASPLTRAERRLLQGHGGGGAGALERIAAEIAARDAQDAARASAPLKCAPDAVVIETDGMDPEAVLRRALSIIGTKLGSGVKADISAEPG